MKPLVIVGASTRAAAMSALRAGYQPYCADYFADADLACVCPVHRVEDYPDGLAQAAATFPDAPWMYTGGLENYRGLVRRIAKTRTLLGNSHGVLQHVRDPRQLAEALPGPACRFPPWQPTSSGLPHDGTWMAKAYHSAGGHGVGLLQTATLAEPATHYFQRRVQGGSCAAVYVAAGGRSVLLGVTEQLVGVDWTGAAAFRYCGSIGPWTPPMVRDAFFELGDRLASAFGLQGIFGVDIVQEGTTLYAIDINPRFPASVEVLERAGGFSAVGMHVQACQSGVLPEPPRFDADRVFGKAILYAQRRCTMSEDSFRVAREQFAQEPWPGIADVPVTGCCIKAGWPVLTVFAQGESRREVAEQLQASVARWRSIIGA